MKKVFSSHSQLCHVWAQQGQEEGRAGNMFFEGPTIYSYGRHYAAGQIHTKGKTRQFALVNATKYSVSTTAHTSEVADALRGLMPVFRSPDVSDPKAAVKYLDGLAKQALLAPLSRMKVAEESSIRFEFACISQVYEGANLLRRFLGLATISPPKKSLDAIEAHLRKRLARYRELNTPEIMEARRLERERVAKLAEQALQAKLAESIAAFRAGKQYFDLYGLQNELLRVNGDQLETSRGALVPLARAKTLLTELEQGGPIVGARIGHFRVDAVEALDGDTRIHIGCHRLLLSEIKTALAGAPSLRLVRLEAV